MKYKVFHSVTESSECSFLKKSTNHMLLNINNSLRKLLIAAVSICFILFNIAHAQVTMDGSTTTDTTTDTTDTSTDNSTDTDTSTVVDLIEGTGSEPTTEPEPVEDEDTGSGGGGGGGVAIVALVAVGAVAVYALSRTNKKKPKIQKTLLSDQVSGVGSTLIDVRNQSHFIEKGIKPTLSFQYGSYQAINELSQPYSFFNVRYHKSIGSALNLNANAGTRFFTNTGNTFTDSQWLTLGLFSKDVFNAGDRLELTAKYATGDIDENSDSILSQGVVLQDYDTLFSDQNSRFELAYSRVLGQNQRLRFLVQKLNSSSEDYAAKLAWRYAF